MARFSTKAVNSSAALPFSWSMKETQYEEKEFGEERRETKEPASKNYFSVAFDLHGLPELVSVEEQISLLSGREKGAWSPLPRCTCNFLLANL